LVWLDWAIRVLGVITRAMISNFFDCRALIAAAIHHSHLLEKMLIFGEFVLIDRRQHGS
jgi:hypothetical protein